MTGRRLLLACVFAAACSKHDVIDLTPWLRVDVQRPKSDSGIIRIGSSQETGKVKVGDRWQMLGMGNRGGYAILGEEALTANAAVVGLGHGDPLLVRPDAPPRPLQGAVYCPNNMYVDVMRGNGGETHIDRYDATGRQIGNFAAVIPSEYSDCRITGIRGYAKGIPYVDGLCNASSPQARCLVIAAGKQQVVYAVKPDAPPRDCEFPKLQLLQASSAYRHFD